MGSSEVLLHTDAPTVDIASVGDHNSQIEWPGPNTENHWGPDSNSCMAIVPVTPAVVPNSNSTSTGKDAITFAGLLNTGMTCYMNSLLQTLYMTPEFRNALYQWQFDGNVEQAQTNIPFQLQRLFLQLHSTKLPAISTIGVTSSFGWTDGDIIQQQDIHELCRVMFDALEKILGSSSTQTEFSSNGSKSDIFCDVNGKKCTTPTKTSATHDLINRLYQGKRSDCVRCMVCGRVSRRPDTFLDIQVPLRSFAADSEPYDSLETAFQAMLKPERLDGTNQYYCSRCKTKCDAERVAAFHRMPYLLTLQLMRFTFDLKTLNRIKLNDQFTFPLDKWDVSDLITPLDDDDDLVEDCPGDKVAVDPKAHTLRDSKVPVVTSSNTVTTARVKRKTVRTNGNAWSEDEFEEMGIETADSGVNSTSDSSPSEIPFTRSPTIGSPVVEEETTNSNDLAADITDCFSSTSSSGQRTITATQQQQQHGNNILEFVDYLIPDASSGMVDGHVKGYTRKAGAQLDTDDEEYDDDDDGFATGDARSACSSTTNYSNLNGHLALAVSGINAVAGTSSITELTPDRKNSSVTSQQKVRRMSGQSKEKSSESTVYELFSIMVHSGSTGGGHYYAYIKSFTDGQWYCFNDRSVTRASANDLKDTFGCKPGSVSRPANAYFLMYRQVDPSRNEQFMLPDQFPMHIKKLLESIKAEETESTRKMEQEQSAYRFVVHTRLPNTQEDFQRIVIVPKSSTLAEAALLARKALLPNENSLDVHNCRLVRYMSEKDTFVHSAEHSLWHRPFSSDTVTAPPPSGDSASSPAEYVQTRQPTSSNQSDAINLVTIDEFAGTKRDFPFELWLEHRLNVPGSLISSESSTGISQLPVKWRAYEPGGITFIVSRTDVLHEVIYAHERIWLPRSATLYDLAGEIFQLFTGQSYSRMLSEASEQGVVFPGHPSYFQLVFLKSELKPCLPLPSCAADTASISSQCCSIDWATLLFCPTQTDPFGPILLSNWFLLKLAAESNRFCVFVDFGPHTDGLVAACQQQQQQSNIGARISINGEQQQQQQQQQHQQSVAIKRGKWHDMDTFGSPYCSDSAIVFRDRRQHQLCSLIEQRLFFLELTVQVPSEENVLLLLLLRRLLCAASLPQEPSPSTSTTTSSNELVDEANIVLDDGLPPPAVNDDCDMTRDWNEWLNTPKKHLLDRGTCTKRPSSTGISPSDSTFSVTAHQGTPPSQIFTSAEVHSCSQSPDLNSRLNRLRASGNTRVRSNSQSAHSSRGHSSAQERRRRMRFCHTTDNGNPQTLTSSFLYPCNQGVDGDGIQFLSHSSSLNSVCGMGGSPGAFNGTLSSSFFVDPSEDSFQQRRIPKFCVLSSVNSYSSDSNPNASDSRTLRIGVDRRLGVDQFRDCLASHLQLDARFFEIQFGTQSFSVPPSLNLMHVDSSDVVTVNLRPTLDSSEILIALRVLDLCCLRFKLLTHFDSFNFEQQSPFTDPHTSPVWPEMLHVIYKADWTVEQLLTCAALHLQERCRIRLTSSNLRLRKYRAGDLTPGVVIPSNGPIPLLNTMHQGFMVQLVPSSQSDSDSTESTSGCSASAKDVATQVLPNQNSFVFVRRYSPSELACEPVWHELRIPPSIDRKQCWSVLCERLSEVANLPRSRLSMLVCNFPGNISPPINNEKQWNSCDVYDPCMSVPSSGQVVFFKDNTECCPVSLTLPVSDSGESSGITFNTLTGTDNVKTTSTSTVFGDPVYGPHNVSPSSSNNRLNTSNSHGDMWSFGNDSSSFRSYERPLRIYTSTDMAPSRANGPGSVGLHGRRESRTP